MSFKSLFAASCITLACMSMPFVVSAQPGNPGPDPDPGTAVPFDGGVSLLVAAGIGYACKKAYDKRKKDGVVTEKEK